MNVSRKSGGIVAIGPRNPGHVTAGSDTLCVCATIAFFLAFVSAAPAAEQIDQSNLPEWGGGWTHVNPTADGQATMWQTFTPTCPNLTAVEIDILTIDPGRGDDVLTVEIVRNGVVLASTECSVADGFDGPLRFEFPQVALLVPEQFYELTVRDTGATRFGWKYGSNTYERGSRYVFAQERPGSDWFFRTYAAVESAAAKYSGGTGEPNDPYQIATAADLIALGETPEDYGKRFVLTQDIDLDPNLPGGKVFDKAVVASYPLGISFSGVFDGNGHLIRHLTIMGDSHLGLFAQLTYGEVRDLGVVDADITGTGNYVGALAGYNDGYVTQCYSTGRVSGGSYVGGLVGFNHWGYVGAVTGCCSSAVVDGNTRVGGLVGANVCTVIDCYARGSVSGNFGVGGLVGVNDMEMGMGGPATGYIARCYSTSLLTGQNEIGGLVGQNWWGDVGERSPAIFSAEVAYSFWDIQSSGTVISASGTGLTTAEMQTASTFINAGWDFVGETANGTDDIWWIDEGKDYPRLRWEAAPAETQNSNIGARNKLK